MTSGLYDSTPTPYCGSECRTPGWRLCCTHRHHPALPFVCQRPECTELATHAHQATHLPLTCSAHATSTMIPVSWKPCDVPRCGDLGTYSWASKRPFNVCFRHRTPYMIHLPTSECTSKECNAIATHYDGMHLVTGYCEKHAVEGMQSLEYSVPSSDMETTISDIATRTWHYHTVGDQTRECHVRVSAQLAQMMEQMQ